MDFHGFWIDISEGTNIDCNSLIALLVSAKAKTLNATGLAEEVANDVFVETVFGQIVFTA